MTTRRRPSLRDNMTDGDDTARQLEQAAEIEQIRQGDAEPDAPASVTPASVTLAAAAPAEEPAARTVFEDSPSPVAALAHAYMHGPGGAPAAASSSGRGLTAVAAVLGLLAIGLAAGAAVLSLKEQRITSALPAELQSRIGALESTLGAAFSGTLTDRVTALEKTVAGLEGRVAQASGSSQVIGILAARQLRGALAESAPFGSELALARLSGVADGDLAKALDRVAPLAAEGIPTRGELNGRFATLVPAVLNAELGTTPGGIGAIGETMWGWVTGVATVLRLPASETVVEESKSAALLTRAGIMLEAGDLSGAIERVSLLEGPSAETAKPWVASARARAAADQASTLLANRITDLLAAGKR